ncbi:hydroxyethylthiazole kinase [Elizabethkingia anophelis]|uniref:hydroxyethylthiazole kinase n=1 Tax=Elizabethkingia anophelis TaxID=1117645 RepID=UPI0005311124|nr:hydroxyethylthiazole kinase [Elizabethkingia anophelis]KGT10194.1 hydroxyethylthiazole kinase [Elizabethkingia anophelis]MCT4286160.1 hydroxyethylthiazole kinase [Elizabethkingia anophelis]MDV3567751.1 hydroxyethylthiazole kinase [Elizabethkingia anophelis]MDV3875248.1 hydroxyethylthiazole kinase [Elizabethkingia anophelis]MDV3969420.1 hydroxyethylthiazole kinase [Elizabethkingia anophelis]
MTMEAILWKHILSVRQKSPLVHNITNFVVMNNTANALLAVGASPIMAHASSEVKEMVNIASALVINIGTLDETWTESMLIAVKEASSLNKPWILDPVGAGATTFRDSTLSKLLHYHPTVIRGNASEIIALAKANKTTTKGVDSTTESIEAMDSAKILNEQYRAIICISGEKDIIIDGEKIIFISNGHPLMTKVTGLGCSASALIGAFIGCIDNKTEATTAAMALLGISGEIAVQESKGPGSLQMNLIDKLYNITEEEFKSYIKISMS